MDRWMDGWARAASDAPDPAPRWRHRVSIDQFNGGFRRYTAIICSPHPEDEKMRCWKVRMVFVCYYGMVKHVVCASVARLGTKKGFKD